MNPNAMHESGPRNPRRPMFDVYMYAEAHKTDPTDLSVDAPVRVVITHGDQLRAELEARSNALPGMKEAPMHTTTVWAWAAMVRMGLYADVFQQFMLDLGELGTVKQDPDAPESSDQLEREGLGPTTPEDSTSSD